MKLRHRLFYRLSLLCLFVIGVWSIGFYFIIVDEINDETDDYLEDQAPAIIRGFINENIPEQSGRDNNTYRIEKITKKQFESSPVARFYDEMVYIPEKQEDEPARTLEVVFKDYNNYYLLVISTPTIEKHDLKESIFHALLFLVFSLAVVFIISILFLFKRELSPLYKLLNWLKTYKIGDKTSIPKTKSKVTEFRELYSILDKSIKVNEEIFAQQKQFVDNASHELQTPLARVKNQIELLLENENIDEDLLSELIRILNNINDIISTNKTLLFLSKIDNRQFLESTSVNFNKIVHVLSNDFAEAYGNLNISVEIIEYADLIVNMNEVLAKAVVVNLLKNAYLHNVSSGKIIVEISDKSISFANTSNSPELNAEKIFKRFYKATDNKHSSGLGLSIIDSICKFYGFTINYKYANALHFFYLDCGGELI
ncbi:MAG: HAMP domain-containing histidine kinase [Prevotellaceae bacterium]|jgi:signal transduction histidine kinase|nr:HAMP domain-containing histidine kinase [Prevotellaceae bacterium]